MFSNLHILVHNRAMYIFRNNVFGIVALVVVIFVGSYVFLQEERTAGTLTRLTEKYTEVDKNTDQLENRITKLKQEGFVEVADFSDVSLQVIASIVRISSSSQDKGAEDFLGTGFLISTNGYLVTAKHVVDAIGADNILVTTLFGDTYQPELISADSDADIALLKIPGSNYPNVSFGYFENISIGDDIGLIGFNKGFAKPLVFRGVISGKGTDAVGGKVFSVNAFINKGNSGGPVFSAKTGRVLGVLRSRQLNIQEDRFIILPPDYTPAFAIGSLDPVRLNVDLYNETLKVIGDVSQVGIGFATAIDTVRELVGQ